MMKVAASVAELEIPTTAIRHGRLILRKTRKKGESVCFSSNNNHFEFESVPLNGSSPRKVRKRLIINSIKKKKEDGLLGLDWLERIGASNTTSTTRDIPHVQVLRYATVHAISLSFLPINVTCMSVTPPQFTFKPCRMPFPYLFRVRVRVGFLFVILPQFDAWSLLHSDSPFIVYYMMF